MSSANQLNRSSEKLARMKQPVALQSNEILLWGNGRGTDVWAMISAAITGDLKTIKELTAKDANLLNCYYEYLSPIRFAVRENHKEVVEYFLDKGVSPMVEFGDSLLTLARDRGYDELAAFIASKLKQWYHISAEGDKLPELIREF